ncbi:hypothetical protein JL720_376 [Aureococcus anophagefferens]|nr:hypothetical protein JL720_376 [Aureococcus anophagefferens]
MAAWVKKVPAPREAIIHAISFGPDNLFVVGDDEALTVYAAAGNGVVRRWDDLSTVLSAALLRLEDGAVVAAGGTMRGEIHLRSIAGDAAAAAGVAAAPRPLSAAVEAVALRGRRLALALSVLGSHDGPLVSCYELPEDESPFEIDPGDSDGDDGDLGDALAIDYAGEPADPFAPVLVAKLDARADPASKCADAYAVDLDGDLLVAGGADGTLSLWRWRAGAPELLWRARCGTSVNAVSTRARRLLAVAVPAEGDSAILQLRDVGAAASRARALAVPRWGPTTTAGVAETRAAARTSCGAAPGPGCLEWLCESSSAMASFDHGGIQQALNEAMAGSPEYETEPGFGPEQSCRRWVRGPGCWVRDEPELLEPCKTILEGGTEVQCVADSNDEYDGVERVKIFKPCDGWVARGHDQPRPDAAGAAPDEEAAHPLPPRVAVLGEALRKAAGARAGAAGRGELFFVDGPFRSKAGPPDSRCKPFVDEAAWKTTPNFSWWEGGKPEVAMDCFQHVFDAYHHHECDALLGFSGGAAVACQMPKWIEGVKFVVLVGAVGEKAIQFLDKNCPTFHALDPSATWGAMSHRISFHWKIATLGKHAEGDKIPADAKVYKKLNAFMAEFVGGHLPHHEELYDHQAGDRNGTVVQLNADGGFSVGGRAPSSGAVLRAV